MQQKLPLSILSVLLAIPGIVLRSMHLLHGFDTPDRLPIAGSVWFRLYLVYLLVCALVLLWQSSALRARQNDRFEALLGSQSPLFRTLMIASAFLLIGGGAWTLVRLSTEALPVTAPGGRVIELVFGALTVLTGIALYFLAVAQGKEMTANAARLTLPTLFWSSLHLLVTYRAVCIDPALPSFAFELLAQVCVILAMYHFARLLYGKPQPLWFGFFAAIAVTFTLSNAGGAIVCLLSQPASISTDALLRSLLSAFAALMLLAELGALDASARVPACSTLS